MLKFTLFFLVMITAAYAQKGVSPSEVNLQMCGEANYRFDDRSKECIYCAHGLKYDKNQKCVGIPDVLGKCFANHYYQAKTQECTFCALGNIFNKTSRKCEKEK